MNLCAASTGLSILGKQAPISIFPGGECEGENREKGRKKRGNDEEMHHYLSLSFMAIT